MVSDRRITARIPPSGDNHLQTSKKPRLIFQRHYPVEPCLGQEGKPGSKKVMAKGNIAFPVSNYLHGFLEIHLGL